MVMQTPGVMSVREAAARRRSIRAYASTPVPQADLFAMVATANQAPSAFNLQPWRFIIVEREDLTFALAEVLSHYPQAASAPAFIVLYTDTADALDHIDEIVDPGAVLTDREAAQLKVKRTFAGMSEGDREMWGAAQGAICLGYLLLAAEEQGYHACPVVDVNAERVRMVLDLPRHARLVAVVAVGSCIESSPPPRGRGLERIVRFA